MQKKNCRNGWTVMTVFSSPTPELTIAGIQGVDYIYSKGQCKKDPDLFENGLITKKGNRNNYCMTGETSEEYDKWAYNFDVIVYKNEINYFQKCGTGTKIVKKDNSEYWIKMKYEDVKKFVMKESV